jgi:hypothetical protein
MLGQKTGRTDGVDVVLKADSSTATDSIEPERCAWAYWPTWNGGPDLIQRVARAAVWTVRDAGFDQPRCRINVEVREDVESFDSPEDFRQNVTGEGLQKFDGISMTVGGTPQLVVRLSLVRTDEFGVASQPGKLPQGVHLSVLTDGSWSREERAAMRGVLMAAVSRGTRHKRSKGGQDTTIRMGDSEDGPAARDVIQDFLHPPKEPLPPWLIGVMAAPVFLLVALYSFPQGFEGWLTECTSIGGSSALELPLRGDCETANESGEFATVASFIPDQYVLKPWSLLVVFMAGGAALQYGLMLHPGRAPPQQMVRIAGVHGTSAIRRLFFWFGNHAGGAIIALVLGVIWAVIASRYHLKLPTS